MMTPSEEIAQIEIAESRMLCINRHKEYILTELRVGGGRHYQHNLDYWTSCLRLVNKDDHDAGRELMAAYAAAAAGEAKAT